MGNQQHNRCNSEDFCAQYQTKSDHNRPRSYELCFPSTEVLGTENSSSNGNSKASSSLSSNVQALKQNFEAKAKGKSLPSSPIATHTTANVMNPIADHDCSSTTDNHDFSVQGLVSKYQLPGSLQLPHVITTAATTNRRPKSFYETNVNTVDSKYYKRSNSLRSNNNRSQFQNDQDNVIVKKPPPFMSVLPPQFPTITTNFTQTPQTVNNIRQQHGKTHPLSKLSHRIKTAAFNTM